MGLRVEFIRQHLYARFEAFGASLRFRDLACGLHELFVRDGERDVIDDAACDGDVGFRERVRTPGDEADAHQLIAGAGVDPDE